MMHIESMKLRNWRSYKYAKFEFPKPDAERNVILISGANECGKTSFFEALAMGLYGRHGLRLVPRARTVSGDDEAQLKNYSSFMQNTLHKETFPQDTRSPRCEVELEFNLHGEPLVIQRHWHFGENNGRHMPQDDEVRVLRNNQPVYPPAYDVQDREEWYRDYIARSLLPVDLANFFLFDGEQAQLYASLDMADQVKRGIKGLLGLTVLEGLANDLDTYAVKQRRSVSIPGDDTMRELADEIEAIRTDIQGKKRSIDLLGDEIIGLEKRQDDLARKMDEDDSASMSDIVDLTKEEEKYKNMAASSTQQICDLLAGEMALVLVGEKIRNETLAQLEAEEKREQWETGRHKGSEKFNQYHSDLSRRLTELNLFDKKQKEEILAVVEQVWRDIWDPRPDGSAESYLHGGLMGRFRSQAMEAIQEIDREVSDKLRELVHRRTDAMKEANRKKDARIKSEARKPEVARIDREQYNKVCSDVTNKKSERSRIEREVQTMESDVNSKESELRRLTKNLTSEPIRRAEYANRFSGLIQKIAKSAMPSQAKNIGVAMTKAWKNMSHMPERVEKVEVTDDCEVLMLSRDGKNLREIEKSAGGDQIFTQALFWSVAHVSQHGFPFVVDTPLARLSHKNRLGVIKQFTDHSGQVILLSTDTEVVGDVLKAISDRIAARWTLELHEYEEGIGNTTIKQLGAQS